MFLIREKSFIFRKKSTIQADQEEMWKLKLFLKIFLLLKVSLGKEKRKSRVCSSTLNPKDCSDHILLYTDAKMPKLNL